MAETSKPLTQNPEPDSSENAGSSETDDIVGRNRHTTESLLSDEDAELNSLSIVVPEQHSEEEAKLWESDRKVVMEFAQKHAELFLHAIVMNGMQTVLYPGNVEGERRSKFIINKPAQRLLVTVAMPFQFYDSPIDGRKMNTLLNRASHFHTKYGITYTNGNVRECYGDELFRQIFNMLMTNSWLKIRDALKAKGTEMDPTIIQSAMRIGVMAARRMGIENIGGNTVGDVRQTVEDFNQKDMFKESDNSASRSLGIEMAYHMMESFVYALPTNDIGEIAYHSGFKACGITKLSLSALFLYEKMGVRKVKRAIGRGKACASSPVHQRMLQEALGMMPADAQKRLMIPEILACIYAGRNFRDFEKQYLKHFDTEPDEKYGHHLQPPFTQN